MTPVKSGLAQRTDEQLVMDTREALARGDATHARRCAGLLWIRLEPRMRLRVARKVPLDDLDDVCGSVAEHLMRYVFRSAGVPQSIVAIGFAIVDRRIADHFGVGEKTPTPVEEVEPPGAPDGELEALLDQAAVDDVLASLDERSATILRRTLAGEPPDEIARDLGLSRTNLDVIAHRARKKLRKMLEEAR